MVLACSSPVRGSENVEGTWKKKSRESYGENRVFFLQFAPIFRKRLRCYFSVPTICTFTHFSFYSSDCIISLGFAKYCLPSAFTPPQTGLLRCGVSRDQGIKFLNFNPIDSTLISYSENFAINRQTGRDKVYQGIATSFTLIV